MKSRKRFLSLGGGVQSSALALMIAKGEILPVDAAVFADTGWEPKQVYDWLEYLETEVLISKNPFPIFKVSKGNIREDLIKGCANRDKRETPTRWSSIPFFMIKKNGEKAMGMRQCTYDYKIYPLHKMMRQLCGLQPKQKANDVLCDVLLGISWDEKTRMNPSKNAWSEHLFPLIERRMTRLDCIQWLEKNNYPIPPKSACIGCPYRNDNEWRLIKKDPVAWADAVEVDRIIRNPNGKMESEQYMHRSCVPLDQVDLETLEEKGQLNMFLDDCEGMCGV